jgi:hypothetical protein
MPRVWNKRDPNCPKDAVYVGRPTKWGNPFKVAVHGRDACIELYKSWINDHDCAGFVIGRWAKEELRGKDLVCWCAPRPCHADILLQIANED